MTRKKLPNLIILIILTTIVTIFCILFNVYRVFTKRPTPVVSRETLLKIDPQFDTKTLDTIKERIYP